MFPTIQIGTLVFPTVGLAIIFGAWLMLSLVERTAEQLEQNRELIYGVAATAVFIGFIGARLTFVLQYWPAFRSSPLSIIWPLNSGYNILGGLALGLVSAFFYGRAKRLSLLPTLDALIPGAVFALMVVSLADFLGGPGYGSVTNLPWGITQFGVRRHPVQLYELAAGALALFTWWRVTRPPQPDAGRPFLLTTAAYSAGRLLVDAFRENTLLIGDGYHLWQVVSLLILLAALIQMSRLASLAPDA